MDQDKQSKTQADFILPLPEPVGLAEMEERRRSFWVLFTFDVYASIRTGSKTSIDGEVFLRDPRIQFIVYWKLTIIISIN